MELKYRLDLFYPNFFLVLQMDVSSYRLLPICHVVFCDTFQIIVFDDAKRTLSYSIFLVYQNFLFVALMVDHGIGVANEYYILNHLH
jgi:hypothetical protein